MAYTTIDKPSETAFNTVLYTGNNNTNAQTVGFQPDWVWLKVRSAGSGQDHTWYDSVRGATKFVESNTSNAEATGSNYLTSFDSNGFTLGNDQSHVNASGDTYVSWNWKAGGSASANSDGSTASSVSVNTDSGFSIVSYTGAGATTYGHGLNATPNVIIIKKRTSDSGNNNWFVYHDKVITAGGSNKSFLTLNETGALTSNGSATTFTSVSSATFGVGTDNIISESSHEFIAYVFAEKKGYSKFGSYTGNGNANGTFVYTGFKPAFVLGKRTDSGGGWWILDSKRSGGFNLNDEYLLANDSQTEADDGSFASDFLANGWKARATNGNFNADGGEYIYMAFAENPFVTSGGVPATAR